MSEDVLDQLIPVENPEEELSLDAETERFLDQLDLNQIDLYRTTEDKDFTGEDFLVDAEDKAVIGPVDGKPDNIIKRAPNTHLKTTGTISGNDVLYGSDGASITAESVSGGRVLVHSDGASITAESVSGYLYGVLYGSDGASITAESVSGGSVLCGSDGAFVFSDYLNVRFNVGEESNGSLLVSRVLDVRGEIYAGVDVVTAEDREGVLTYTGDWEELRGRLESRFEDGLPEALKAFQLEEEYADTVEQVEGEFEKIEEMYEEVREEHQIYRNAKELLDLEDLEGSNEERFKQLKSVKETAREKIQQNYDIRDENVDRLLKSNQPGYLLEQVENIKKTTDLDIDDFIEEFHQGSEKYTEKPGFEYTKHINPTESETLTQDVEELNEELYQDGIKLLKDLKHGRGEIRPQIRERDSEEYHAILEKYKEVGEEKEQAFRNENHERGQELIQKQEELEERKEEIEQEYLEKAVEEEMEEVGGEVEELEDLDMKQMKAITSQLYQEYLKEGKKHKKAREIARNLKIETDEITANTIHAEVWGKDLKTLPTHKKYRCCYLPGGAHEENLTYMMEDPQTQLLQIQTGKHDIIALTRQVENPETGEDYLLVDSIESESNVMKRQNITQAVDQAITKYAEQLEQDAVIYNDKTANSAPQQFLDNLEHPRQTIQLEEGNHKDRWTETRMGENKIYHKDI